MTDEQQNATRAETLLSEGGNCFAQGDVSTAVKLFEEALELSPGNPTAHYNLGLVHRKLGNFATAMRHLKMVAESDPDNMDALDCFAECLLGAGRLDQAELLFTRILERQPGRNGIKVKLAHVAILRAQESLATGDLERAERSLRSAVERGVRTVQTYGLLGSLVRYRHLQKAKSYLERAARYGPSLPERDVLADTVDAVCAMIPATSTHNDEDSANGD